MIACDAAALKGKEGVKRRGEWGGRRSNSSGRRRRSRRRLRLTKQQSSRLL